MMTAGFLTYLAGAVTMGMSCGTGCSPAISVFLSSYVFHAEGDTKKSIFAFLNFFFGKGMAVLTVCILSALLGNALLDQNGYWGQYKMTFVMPFFLILTGVYMLRKCYTEYRGNSCGSCSGSCHSTGKDRIQSASPFIGGFLYGITPCAPLIILAGYAVTMPMGQALILGIVFSLSCTMSPLLLMLMFTKLIVVKMQNEVPTFFKAAKALMSFGVLLVGVTSLFA